MKLAFATAAVSLRTSNPWLNGGTTTSLTTHSRYKVSTARKRNVTTRWFAVSGTPTPPPSSSDDDENNENNEINNQGDSSSTSRANRSDDGSRDSEFDVDLTGNVEQEDENELFQFVKSVPPPELVKKFSESAPSVVQNAIRETLISMLGSLPPLAFTTNVSTMSSNLVQLFHSSLVTGYMFRNATYRLELTRSLDWSGLKALPAKEEQPIIEGGVAIFKQDDGSTMEVPVEQYISDLRQTVNNLQSELTRERKGGNELLSFISTMEKENLEALTKNAGSEVIDAMKKVCDVVTKSQGINSEQERLVQASAPELGQLLFYLMVSGFFLREAEVHLDLQRKLGGDGSNLKNLLEEGSSEQSSN